MLSTQANRQPKNQLAVKKGRNSLPPKLMFTYGFGIFGLFMLILAFVLSPSPAWLSTLHENTIYKQASGFVLLIYILLQWRLTKSRVTRDRDASRRLQQHKKIGVLGCYLLGLHSIDSGYVFITIMLSCFVATIVLGVANRQLLPINHKAYIKGWMFTHVLFAMTSTLLVMRHVYLVYLY